MQIISGYFSDRLPAPSSIPGMHRSIEEMRGFFEKDTLNVVILDSFDFDRRGVETVWKRSANETNLLLIYLESVCGSRGKALAEFYQKKISRNPDYVLPQEPYKDFTLVFLQKLNQLRREIPFRLLFEKNSSKVIEKMKQFKKSETQISSAVLKGDAKVVRDLTKSSLTSFIEGHLQKEPFIHEAIDRALAASSDLRLHLNLGTSLWPVLDPYYDQNGVLVFSEVKESMGSIIFDHALSAIRNGEKLPERELALWEMHECVEIFVMLVGEVSDRLVIPFPEYYDFEKYIDLDIAYKEWDYEKILFRGGDKLNSINAFLKGMQMFLQNMGVLAALEVEFPKMNIVEYLDLIKKTLVIGKPSIGRNSLCPCGSGLKYKRCCIDKTMHLNSASG